MSVPPETIEHEIHLRNHLHPLKMSQNLRVPSQGPLPSLPHLPRTFRSRTEGWEPGPLEGRISVEPAKAAVAEVFENLKKADLSKAK